MTSTVPKLEKAGGRTYSTLAMITCLVLDVSVNSAGNPRPCSKSNPFCSNVRRQRRRQRAAAVA